MYKSIIDDQIVRITSRRGLMVSQQEKSKSLVFLPFWTVEEAV